MKLIVFSDSHGDLDAMIQAVEQERPDRILHLGDYWEDGRELSWIYPDLPLEQVPGNCDWVPDTPLERVITLEGCRIAFCHGHTRGVKLSYRDVVSFGETAKAAVVLCGHTHRPYYEQRHCLHVLNPGAIGCGQPSYGILHLSEEAIQPSVVSLTDNKKIL